MFHQVFEMWNAAVPQKILGPTLNLAPPPKKKYFFAFCSDFPQLFWSEIFRSSHPNFRGGGAATMLMLAIRPCHGYSFLIFLFNYFVLIIHKHSNWIIRIWNLCIISLHSWVWKFGMKFGHEIFFPRCSLILFKCKFMIKTTTTTSKTTMTTTTWLWLLWLLLELVTTSMY